MTSSFDEDFDFMRTLMAIAFFIFAGMMIASAIFIVVHQVIKCLQKAGIAIPGYAPISTTDQESLLGDIAIPPRSDSVVVAIPPDYPRARGPRVTSMERLLSTIAKEKPKRWTWEMIENDDLAEMLKLCGIDERDREQAERMSMVALWCVQYQPELRPMMSTVVKMLEGEMEITPPPYPKFQYLESFFERNGSVSGGNESSDPLPSATRTSEPSSSNHVG
ncbi:unnamed protein product [Ilex paraguariensis]|uniref:Uncharacterized protein n=1 Tax=Ilex paraguariensis TaxID=185542 RepID=A0ABC8TIZ4_9AQUA